MQNIKGQTMHKKRLFCTCQIESETIKTFIDLTISNDFYSELTTNKNIFKFIEIRLSKILKRDELILLSIENSVTLL
jgi:hypothetical protein